MSDPDLGPAGLPRGPHTPKCRFGAQHAWIMGVNESCQCWRCGAFTFDTLSPRLFDPAPEQLPGQTFMETDES